MGRVGCDCDVGEGEGGHGDGGGLRDLMVVVMGFCGGILGELIRAVLVSCFVLEVGLERKCFEIEVRK